MPLTIEQLRSAAWGMLFQEEVGQLWRAYQASRAGLDRECEELNARHRRILAGAEANGGDTFEYDEDGNAIYDHAEETVDNIIDLSEVIKLVEEAFIISLDHFWERHFNKRLNVKTYSAPAVFEYLRNRGCTPNEAALSQLRYASNVARHTAGRSANDLFACRPDLFDAASVEESGFVPDYDSLRVSHDFVVDSFNGVRNSGPQRRFGL